MVYIFKNYVCLEVGYCEKVFKFFFWVCGCCLWEFVYFNLCELMVYYIDYDYFNNLEDGSNWEMLCLYCYDYEYFKYIEVDQYGFMVVVGEDV